MHSKSKSEELWKTTYLHDVTDKIGISPKNARTWYLESNFCRQVKNQGCTQNALFFF